jgi:hypothetical protein
MAEQAFRDAFNEYGLHLFTAYEVFPNFNEMDEADILAQLKKNNIHSVLTITPSSAVDLAAAIERNDRFQSKKLVWANQLIFYANPDPVIPATEVMYSGIEGQFSLRLYDLESEKIAWLGVSVSARTGLGSFQKLICNNAKETVRTLSSQKLIAPAVTAE